MTDEVVAPGPAVIEQNISGVVGVLAEALAEHRFREPECICTCGALCGLVCDGLSYAEHVASVVAALPNIAIVPLETGEFFEWADGTQTQVWDGPLQTVQTWPEANEIILRDDFEHSVSVADVARQGAIFLAAARAAGGQG